MSLALGHLLDTFQPISLEEMDAVALQQRVDTKFVFADHQLPGLLEELLPHYRLLHAGGARGTEYRSLYLDTADLRGFREHHNGRVLRHKVRYREYVGSDLFFLEVKRKTGRGDTDKRRLRVESIPNDIPADHHTFIKKMTGWTDPVRPTLWNRFTRLTFVDHDRTERLTVDMSIRFTTINGSEKALEGICVAELKRQRGPGASHFAQAVRERGIRPGGMSKYCVGLLLVDAAPKYNAFKPLLMQLVQLHRAA
ncbi:MAG: polyphosphate polymerase domain-containing protein [Flavobacteriales bacterium]|nr:polyphosphate polymerase domain-containing protein [Flavobacteriales bacterium]